MCNVGLRRCNRQTPPESSEGIADVYVESETAGVPKITKFRFGIVYVIVFEARPSRGIC